MARRRKRRLRIDRLIILLVIFGIICFGIYKGISLAISFISTKTDIIQVINKEDTEKEYIATVILDPGHGGYDVGANVESRNLYEKDIVLTTALAAAEVLEENNIKAVLTRSTDVALSDTKSEDLLMRAQMSEENGASYFVSIHVNDYDGENTVSGFEAYIKDDDSQDLANAILTQMEALNYSENRGIVDGSKLAVLRDNTVPSVLIEMGYIQQDYDYLGDDDKLEQIGHAIAQGIILQVSNTTTNS